MSKLVEESGLKPDGYNDHVGSSPTTRTILDLYPEFKKAFRFDSGSRHYIRRGNESYI